MGEDRVRSPEGLGAASLEPEGPPCVGAVSVEEDPSFVAHAGAVEEGVRVEGVDRVEGEGGLSMVDGVGRVVRGIGAGWAVGDGRASRGEGAGKAGASWSEGGGGSSEERTFW